MAAPNLTYGGFQLLTDTDQLTADFLDHNQSLEDLRNVAPSVARVGSRADGLAYPNYPTQPKIRPNQLYWPTGAARWSIGYFFAGDAAKDQIVAAAHGSGSASLELRVVTNREFKAQMFLLPPRRISGEDHRLSCWLIPLVDERYYWQFEDIGDFAVTTSSTWAAMYTQLGTRLGVTIDADTVASPYLIPDPESLTRRFDNASTLLDAVAHSVGQRIVRWPDGTIKAMNWATSATQLTTNIESKTPWSQIAGGPFDYGPVPASVNVVFPRFVDHVAIPRKVHAINKTPAAGTATIGSAIKTIHSTAYADFTLAVSAPDSTEQPNNLTASLDDLAAEIATDYYASTAETYDRTFSGIKLWDSCGYDDHILYQFGGEYPRPKLSGATRITDGGAKTEIGQHYDKWSHTRVQSAPINFGVEWQMSQDASLRPLVPLQFGDLDGTLSVGSTAVFSVWENDDADDRQDTGHTEGTNDLRAFNFPGVEIPSGTKSHALFDFESEKWYPVNAATSATVNGSSGAVFSGTCEATGAGPVPTSCWTQDVVSGAAGYDTVTVKKDGAGSPFVVRLPHVGAHSSSRAGPSPNLAPGNIISYVINEDGVAVISSDYDASVIGAIEMWDGDLTDVPFGWKIHDVMIGRIPVGVDATQTGSGITPDLSAFADVGSAANWVTSEVNLTHTDDLAVTLGLDHSTLDHSGGAAPGLGHDGMAHADSPLSHTTSDHTIANHSDLTHTWVSGVGDDHDPDTNELLQNHIISAHAEGSGVGFGHDTSDHTLVSHTPGDHTVANHSTETHEIDLHSIAGHVNYGAMRVVLFVIRFHE